MLNQHLTQHPQAITTDELNTALELAKDGNEASAYTFMPKAESLPTECPMLRIFAKELVRHLAEGAPTLMYIAPDIAMAAAVMAGIDLGMDIALRRQSIETLERALATPTPTTTKEESHE